MIETDYSEAAVEVLNVMQYINMQDMKKIPQSFIKFLQSIAAKNYKVNFDREIKIENLNLQEKSKELLGFIYITWLCDKKEFAKWKNEIQKEKTIRDKSIHKEYNPNTLFEKRNKPQFVDEEKSVNQIQNLEMVTYKEKNIIQRILKKIRKWFGQFKS